MEREREREREGEGERERGREREELVLLSSVGLLGFYVDIICTSVLCNSHMLSP